jgi:MtrB/PioB family decaheme-associated outer membrane protein
MKRTLGRFVLGIGLLPSAVWAQEDSFDLSAAPTPKEPPRVLPNTIEVGLGYQSRDSFYFGRYGGVANQGLIPFFDLSVHSRAAWDSGKTLYWDIGAGLAGVDNGYVSARVGEQGKWRFAANFDSFTRWFTDSAKTPFDGAGTDRLTLPSNWVGGAASQQFAQLNNSLKPLELKTKWQSVGGDYVLNPKHGYEFRLHYDYRHKEGLRANGITFGNEANYGVGVFFPQPVDYESHRVQASFGYADPRWQWSAAYSLSLFRDGLTSVTVQNPYSRSLISSWPAGGFAGYPFSFGQYSLPPNSAAHQFAISGGYAVTPRTRLTARVSFTIQTQNAPFLPYTINPNLVVTTPMPRASLGGVVHKTFANLGLTSREWKNVDVALNYSYDGRDNQTPQSVYDYITNDAQDQPNPLNPGVSPYFRTNLPYSFTFQQARAEVGYRVAPRTRLSVSYTGDFKSRTYQAVARTTEHTFKTKVLTTFSNGSAWVSYSYASRTGTNYRDEYAWDISHSPTYLAASPNNHSIEFALLRKYDLADRRRHELKTGVTWEPRSSIVVDLSGTYSKDVYNNSAFGLRRGDSLILDADVSYVLKDRLTASVFYTFEQIKSNQNGYYLATLREDDPSQIWNARNRDTIHSIGLHMDWQAVPEKLKLTGAYYVSAGATHIDVAANPFVPLAAVSPLPDAREITHNIKLQAAYSLNPALSLQVGYIVERHITADFQNDNAGLTPVAQLLGSGIIPPRYWVHVGTVSVRKMF